MESLEKFSLKCWGGSMGELGIEGLGECISHLLLLKDLEL